MIYFKSRVAPETRLATLTTYNDLEASRIKDAIRAKELPEPATTDREYKQKGWENLFVFHGGYARKIRNWLETTNQQFEEKEIDFV